MKSLLLSAVCALSLTSCIAVVKQPPRDNPPPQEPVHQPPPQHNPPPRHLGPDASLQMKYDTALDDCFDAARKVMGLLRLTEVDQNKKTGVIEGQRGSTYGKCTMYRRNHHTFVTFYFRVQGADARVPVDFTRNAHKSLGDQIKEEGRKTD
ncbi:MAG TPA: hypothetical protein VJU16_00285 [Planctomycetota bacterium]|nr:hypothetical protein [Planctomycetota bacterium]